MNNLLITWMLNGAALVISLTNINNFLRFVLLIASIGYTLYQWWKLIKKENDIDDLDKEL